LKKVTEVDIDTKLEFTSNQTGLDYNIICFNNIELHLPRMYELEDAPIEMIAEAIDTEFAIALDTIKEQRENMWMQFNQIQENHNGKIARNGDSCLIEEKSKK